MSKFFRWFGVCAAKVLSRSYCLKEIGWAIDFKKPILILQEVEGRFWPFDYERWKKDECVRNENGNPPFLLPESNRQTGGRGARGSCQTGISV